MKPIDCENIYNDGRQYDLQNKDFIEDIPFYLNQIKKFGEPVLELACGTGRITIPLAERGVDISGLDISESMLSIARKKSIEKGISVDWVRADCRNFILGKKFNLIFFPFNSIAHLHDLESIELCFTCIRKHLKEGGRFIIDMFNPRLDLLIRDTSQRYPVEQIPDPDGHGTITITETIQYDSASQVNRVKWYYKKGRDGIEEVKDLNMRIFFPQELDMLLHYNGFAIEDKFGDYNETPFISSSPKQLVVCSLLPII